MVSLIIRAIVVCVCFFFSAGTHGNQKLQDRIDLKCRKSCISATELLAVAREKGEKWNISHEYIIALVEKESAYNRKAKRTENGVSAGLMQIQVRWHRDKIAKRDIMNADVNVDVGTQVLRACAIKHKHDPKKSLTCYNGYQGPLYAREVISRVNEIHAILKN